MLNLQYQCQSDICKISASNGTNKHRNSPACPSASAVPHTLLRSYWNQQWLYWGGWWCDVFCTLTTCSSWPNTNGHSYNMLAIAIDQLVFLRFIINLDKSVVKPLRTIEFLSNSTTMTIALPRRKVHQIQQSAKMLRRTQITPTVTGHNGCCPSSRSPSHWRL